MTTRPDTLTGSTDTPPAPLAGTRGEAVQRLQVGLIGLAAMVLLVGLANIIMERARQTEAAAVPDAAATVAVPQEGQPAQKDPLADGGVVPELAQETPTPAPTLEPAQPTDAAEATADIAPVR